MTAEEAFKKFLLSHEHNDLPWEIQEEEMKPTFMAGWHAAREAAKQTDMFGPASIGLSLTTPSVTSAIAEDVYAAYPRKVGRTAAIKAIKVAAKTAVGGMDALLEASTAYAAATKTWPAADKKFIPHPATFFNQGRFGDDRKEWVRGAAAMPSQFSKRV